MSLGNFNEFEEMRFNLERGRAVPDLQMQLGALNIRYGAISDAYHLMEDEEQQAHLSQFLQLQFIYHQIAVAFVSNILDALMLGDAIPPTAQPMEAQVEFVQIDHVPTNDEQADDVIKIFDDKQQEQAMDGVITAEEVQSTDHPIAKPSEEPLVTNQSAPIPAVVFVDEANPPEAGQGTEVASLFPPIESWDDESEENARAMPSLKARVQNELVQSPAFGEFSRIMEPLFSLNGITQVNDVAINAVIKVLVSTAERMRYRGFSIIDYTPMIIALVQRQLDITSQSMWSWYHKGKPLTLDLFMEFLTERVKNILPQELPSPANPFSRPSCANDGQKAGPSSAGGTGTIPKPKRTVDRADHPFWNSDDSASESRKEKSVMKCPRCEANHPLHRCEQFGALTLRARNETVAKAKLCRNCFSSTHKTTDCKKGPCKKCGTKHNSLLCPIMSFYDPKTKL